MIHLIDKKYFLSPSVAAQYQDWFSVLKQLRHSSLLTCLDYWTGSDHHGLVYEYFDGKVLWEAMNDRSLVWDKNQIDDLVGDVLSTLQYVSERGHAHLQVTPRNILYNTTTGEVKLHSFFFNTTAWANYVSALPIELLTEEVLGVMAQDTGAPEADQLELMNYMSPEQVEGLPLNAASDIYSAGVLLFRLVTQTLPYENFHSEAEYADRIRTLTVGDRLAEFQGLPENLTSAVMKATATESEQRFSNAREFEGKIRQLRSVEQTEMTNRRIGDEDIDDAPDERTAYSDLELEDFRRLIDRKLSDSQKELAYLQDLITRGDATSAGGDEDLMEREQLTQMASRQITFIDHLERALSRIENKTYGICRVTGKLIEKERLMVVPHATVSLAAKNQVESLSSEPSPSSPDLTSTVISPTSKSTSKSKSSSFLVWTLIILFAGAVIYYLNPPDAWAKSPVYQSIVSELALRTDTGISALKIRSLDYGESMKVIKIPEIFPWVRVRTNDGIEGFVHGQMLSDEYDFQILSHVFTSERIMRHIGSNYRRRSLIEYYKNPETWNTDSTLKWQPISFYHRGDDKFSFHKQGSEYSYFRVRLRHSYLGNERDVVFIHRRQFDDVWDEVQHAEFDPNYSYSEDLIESLLRQYNLD